MDTKLRVHYREQLKEMLIEKQKALIKEIVPKRDTYEEEEWVYPELQDEPHPPKPKLWYLLVVLKKPAFL